MAIRAISLDGVLTSKTIVKDIKYSFNISIQMLPLFPNLVALPHHFESFEYILYLYKNQCNSVHIFSFRTSCATGNVIDACSIYELTFSQTVLDCLI